MCCDSFKPLHVILSLVTALVCLFDVAVNWFAFHRYLQHRVDGDFNDDVLVISLGCASALGTLIMCLAFRNVVYGCKAFGAEDPEEAQESVQRWQEVTGFLQLVLQDCAVALVMYMTFKLGTCALYYAIIVESETATLVLVGILAGSAWKAVSALINCLCRCCTKADAGCGWGCLCCACRIVTSIGSFLLVGFVAYQLFTFNGIGVEERNDCDGYNSTAT